MSSPAVSPPRQDAAGSKKEREGKEHSTGNSDFVVTSKSESDLHLRSGMELPEDCSPGRDGGGMMKVGVVVVSDDTSGAGEKTEVVLNVGEVTSPLEDLVSPAAVTVVETSSREANPKPSWVKIVKKNKDLKKYEVEIVVKDGVASTIVPDEVFTDSSPLWEDFLIGKFLATIAPHVAKIHSIVNKIWALGDKTQMIDIHVIDSTTMKFRICNPNTRARILRRGMWNLADIPVIMSKWTPFVENKSPEVTSVPLWVHLKKVPMDMFSDKGLSFISSAVGVPVRLHPETSQCVDFKVAKVFVKADLTKELPRLMKFYSNGRDNEIEFSYPWLPPRCSNCNKWGHLNTVCLARLQPQLEKQSNLALVKNLVVPGGVCQKDSPVIVVGVAADAIEEKQTSNSVLDLEEGEWPKVSPTKEKEKTMETDLEEGTKNTEELRPESKFEESWEKVSPSKVGRQMENHVMKQNESNIATPSRFQILSEEKEEAYVTQATEMVEEEDKEEGEFVASSKNQRKHTEVKQKDLGLRQPLPRASKSSHKFVSDSLTQNMKDIPPSVVSKKGRNNKSQ